MVKQGGVSWNVSWHHKTGVKASFRCVVCGRLYKMAFARDRHERQCKQFNKRY